VKVGIHLPQWGPDATREGVLSVALAAEQAGLDSVWVADHVVYPLVSSSRYPYREDGPPFAPEDGFLDAFVTLAAVAGATERVALGLSVLVLPMREPLQVAKALATLDVLSGGRVIAGVGAGWWAEEFAALGARFEGRGRRLDEQIGILRTAWRDGAVDEVALEPRPTQLGGPPILVGGMGAAGRRRAGRLGDGWHALGSHGETLADGFADVRRHARESGRDESALTLSTSTRLPAERDHAVRRLSRLEQTGVDHVVVDVEEDTASALLAGVELLHAEVLPEVRAT
jgi:probable F420-dependent oxidoreductase